MSELVCSSVEELSENAETLWPLRNRKRGPGTLSQRAPDGCESLSQNGKMARWAHLDEADRSKQMSVAKGTRIARKPKLQQSVLGQKLENPLQVMAN